MRALLVIFIFVYICSEATGQQHPVTLSAILSTTSKAQRECIWKCPKTSEYNPICGTDGEKYINISHLRCTQNCGIDVEATHPPPCLGTTTTTDVPWPLPPRGRA